MQEGRNRNTSTGNKSVRSGYKSEGCDGDKSNEINRSGCMSTGCNRCSSDSDSNVAGGGRHKINGNVTGGKGQRDCSSGIGGCWNGSGDGISSGSNCGQSANSGIGSDDSNDARGGLGRASDCSDGSGNLHNKHVVDQNVGSGVTMKRYGLWVTKVKVQLKMMRVMEAKVKTSIWTTMMTRAWGAKTMMIVVRIVTVQLQEAVEAAMVRAAK